MSNTMTSTNNNNNNNQTDDSNKVTIHIETNLWPDLTSERSKLIAKRLLFYATVVVVISLWIIIVDAFLIKNNVGFTITDYLFKLLDLAEHLMHSIGYWVGRVLNIFQFLWDIVDRIWQWLLPYLPVREAIMAKDKFMRFVHSGIEFLCLGFLVEAATGFVEAFKSNWFISTLLSFGLCSVGLSYINAYLNSQQEHSVTMTFLKKKPEQKTN